VHDGHFRTWKAYRDKFNLILTAYSDLQGVMPQFDNNRGMKRHILEFVKESEKEQIEILITSGIAGCKITTSFRDFSQTLKNVKFALKKFRHSIEINLL